MPTELSASQSPRPARPSGAGSLIPIFTSGLVVAIYEVVAAASMAALIFSGELSTDVARGVGLALFGAAITGATIALLGSLPGTIGGVQDAPAAIMALIAGAIVATLPSGASADERFMTVVAAIAISTLLTGACLLAIGYFRLGNLVRFLPYPVVGGFLAGTGWLLFSGGLGMMSGLNLTVANLAQFFAPDVLLLWLPGLLWAIIAFLAMRRFEHALLLPGLIAAGIILFYLVAWLANASPAQLSQQGLLLGPFPEGRMWQPPSFDDLGFINWQAILSQAPAFGTIVILSLVGVLLNSSGLEVTFRKDVNLNRELRAAGIGNLLSGLGAGIIAFQQLSGSALSLGLKAASRWVGIMAAAVCGLFLLFGGSTLSLFPKGILGGLLLLVGLSFLYDWLVPAWSRLPRQDYAVVVIILITTAVVGFLQAVLLGLLIAIILFVVSYSWADVVRAEMSGATFPSRVTRSRWQQALLDQASDQLVIFQ
ncbi:MAG: SulP family inorganic anion transporter, partial [Chloroflexota bacterium]